MTVHQYLQQVLKFIGILPIGGVYNTNTKNIGPMLEGIKTDFQIGNVSFADIFIINHFHEKAVGNIAFNGPTFIIAFAIASVIAESSV